MKKPKLVRDYENGYIKSSRPIENGHGKVPAGTIFLVTSSTHTAHLIAAPCECCGFQFKVFMKGANKFDDFEWLGYKHPNKI